MENGSQHNKQRLLLLLCVEVEENKCTGNKQPKTKTKKKQKRRRKKKKRKKRKESVTQQPHSAQTNLRSKADIAKRLDHLFVQALNVSLDAAAAQIPE